MGLTDSEDRTIARDFVMARLAACRTNLDNALESCDQALSHFLAPETDKKGKERRELLEQIDGLIGEAAAAVQLAQGGWDDVDPTEAEPEGEDPEEGEEEDDDGDGDSESDEEEDDDEDEDED